MTARQHIANYESKLREYTNFAVRGIKKVVKECGPRPSTSPAERKAQQMMQRELEPCCEEVRTESFKAAPKAFLFWIKSGVIGGFLAAAAYNLGFAAVSAVLILLCMLDIVLEFVLYKQAVDVFSPKKDSQNLIGVQKPTGEVKRRLIFCGHADSSNEWTYTYLGHKLFKSTKLTLFIVGLAVVFLLFCLGASIYAVVVSPSWGFDGPLALTGRGKLVKLFGYILAGLCLPLISGWFFENKKRPVEGANDNLTGCFTAIAVARMLSETGCRLENTELVVLCDGCEEIGLRGAKAFVKAHAQEYKDVETVFIALDTMTDYEYMGVYVNDLNSIVKHDPALCAMMRKAGNTAGHDLPYLPCFFGSSDATAATQGGMRAAMFAAMDPAPAAYYHTRLDTCEVLQPKTVEACLDVCMEIAHQFDETGLAPFEGSKVAAMKI